MNIALDAAVETTRSVPVLLAIAAIAIAVLLILIIKVRLHAFYSLVIVSILTALAAGVSATDLLDTVTGPFGETLGGVALLIGFGAVLGRIIEISGGAQVLAESLIRRFGDRKAPFALSLASFLFAFPIFLDAGFIVMLPIIYQVARRLKGGLLLYALPSTGAFLTMHALVPPHPGPTAASGIMGVDVGLVVLTSVLIAIPVWYLAGYRLALVIARRFPEFPVPNFLGSPRDFAKEGVTLPKFSTVLMMLLLPLILITLNTGAAALQTNGTVSGDEWWFPVLTAIGATPIALLITSIVAMIVLVVIPAKDKIGGAIETIVDDALAPVCSIILITGAGGMFGGVLTATGIGGALADIFNSFGLPLIVAGFLIAVVMRVAQGSATVATTTAAGLLAPAVAATGGQSPLQLALIVVALGAGGISFSHVNDSGFWLVSRFLTLSTKDALKSWSVISTAVGFLAFAIAWALYAIVSAVGI
ncbi:GntP family permease [Microbacterium sp. MPKO10]|uniref:GntP family permease n=1 Tax=Microbacterium sp. MPKO10 TaxID=2989818 RepID=UPI00223548D9|nr:gluconate:H+ symporter [Microbacterium sp. MPKO10]MCW4459153.1 gluconate:H+ symporter [Microbacterium sp. MPKO10]